MAVYPSTLGSSVGLKCDADGRVLNADGAPIAGLFACGNDMASIMRGTYPGPGITIGPAMVFRVSRRDGACGQDFSPSSRGASERSERARDTAPQRVSFERLATLAPRDDGDRPPGSRPDRAETSSAPSTYIAQSHSA